MPHSYIKDIGLYRVDTSGTVDKGSDGAMWLPSKRLAVVMDGISGDKGDGSSDVDRYAANLELSPDTVAGVRTAFFDTFGPPGQSVAASLWFPPNVDDASTALLLHAGDCHCFRLRSTAGATPQITRLTHGHTIWNTLIRRPPTTSLAWCEPNEATQAAWQELSHVKVVSDLDDISDREHLKSLIELLASASPSPELLDIPPSKFEESCSTEELRMLLFDIISEYKGSIYCALVSDTDEAKAIVGDGLQVDIQHEDRFLLISDGVDDVLNEEEIELILSTETSASAAAHRLVHTSQAKNIKIDDRVALVVDLDASMQPTPEHLKHGMPHPGATKPLRLSTN